MSYSPLISVITIVYNDLKGLKKTFESVVNQSYNNMEYVIIDGGSSDGSVDFIKEQQEHFSYWVSEKDKGIADAFNKGVQAAKGDWIILLNAADYFQDEYAISKMIPYLEVNQNADIVYGKMTEVDENGELGKSFGRPFDKSSFERECTIIHPATFHNKYFFEKNGLFSLDFKIAMDYEIFLRKRDLKAVFADEQITFMEKGGVSQEDPTRAYKEVNDVKRLHLKKNEISLSMDYYENILRYRLSKFKQRLLKK